MYCIYWDRSLLWCFYSCDIVLITLSIGSALASGSKNDIRLVPGFNYPIKEEIAIRNFFALLRQAALSVMPCLIRLSIPCVLVAHALSLHLKCVIYYLTQKVEIERSELLCSSAPLLNYIDLKINLHIIVHLHNIICIM